PRESAPWADFPSVEAVAEHVEGELERPAGVQRLVHGLLGGARRRRERVAGRRDAAGAAEVVLDLGPAGAGGPAVEVGELGRRGDAGRPEPAEDHTTGQPP